MEWYATARVTRPTHSLTHQLFPGGGQTLDDSQLLAATTFFVKRALQAHAAGDYFPVFGHCQGFESTLMAITGLPLEQCMVHVPQVRPPASVCPQWYSLPFQSSVSR